jgi:molybdopterin synthase catalytic subunit
MKPLGIVSHPDADTEPLVERLVSHLGERGDVATVERLHAPDIGEMRPDTAGADAAYSLGDERWFASGVDRTLRDTLDDLAPDYDYAVVEGYGDADVPQVVVGERDHGGTALATAPEAEDVDVDAIVDALERTEPYETLESLVAEAKLAPAADRAGAIATFTGRVREKDDPDDEPTEYLKFEKYDGVADERLSAIREELLEREGIHEVLLHHRTGVIPAGVDIVFVVVLAGHRSEAFETVEDGIDRLKDEVPLFKKEVTVDDTFWAHDRP